jgi:hypothetical protein
MTDMTRAALEQAAHELDIAENALLCSSFHNAASRAKQAAMTARAAIAADRAQPEPVPGEVQELVGLIRQIALAWEPDATLLGNMTAGQLARAAELLSQRHQQPVPVSERLWEREGWCDEQGKCWWFNPGQPAMSNPHIATSSWRLCRMLNGKPMGAYSLPAHALPLPSKKND